MKTVLVRTPTSDSFGLKIPERADFLSSFGFGLNVCDFGADPTGVADSWPAFKACHDAFTADFDPDHWRGGRILIPRGKYLLSRTWEITKEVLIMGDGAGFQNTNASSILVFPNVCIGIRVYDPWRAPDAGCGQRTRIQDLQLYGTTGGANPLTLAGNHGIYASAAVFIDGCVVQKFSGAGILIEGNIGLMLGGANDSEVAHCLLINNDGHGLWLEAADANNCDIIQVQSSSNKGWSFYDNSKLGNSYYTCLSEGGVGAGSYWAPGASQACQYFGCYVEIGGSYLTNLGVGCQIYGGVLDADSNSPIIEIEDSGGGSGAQAFVVSNGGAGGGINGVLVEDGGSGYTGATTATVVTRGSPGTGATLTPIIVGGKITGLTITAAGTGYLSGLTRASSFVQDGAEGGFRTYRIRVKQRKKGTSRAVDVVIGGAQDALIELQAHSSGVPDTLGAYVWNPSTNSFETAYNGTFGRGMRMVYGLTTTETGGRSGPVPSGSVLFPSGFWVGGCKSVDNWTGDKARFRGVDTRANLPPVAGEYMVGDTYDYSDPVSGGFKGIVCTVAGTPGTWKTFGPIS